MTSRLNWDERTSVVDLSQALLDNGLVVRTWGNISHRTAGNAFVITPSGRTYDTMIEADLSSISTEGEKEGPFKPSSEYPMHALCYELRPGANVVVHTHQRYASALSLLGREIELTDEEAARIGQKTIPISEYGLPGTKKLHSGVHRTLSNHPDADALLLSAHGVFLCGDSAEHALQLAEDVESAAQRIYQELTGSDLVDPQPLAGTAVRSERADGAIHYFDANDNAVDSPDAAIRSIHERCYAERKDIGAIRECFDSEVEHFKGMELRPFLDDFAQIVGTKANATTKANVLLGADYALCFGADDSDAAAVESVLKKNARAARVAAIAGTKPIVDWECILMNIVYRLKYSKQSG